MMDIPIHGVPPPGRALSYTDDEIPVPRKTLKILLTAAFIAAETATARGNYSDKIERVYEAMETVASLLKSEASR